MLPQVLEDSQATVLDTQGADFESQFTQLDEDAQGQLSDGTHDAEKQEQEKQEALPFDDLPGSAAALVLPTAPATEVLWDASQARFIAPHITQLAARADISVGLAHGTMLAIPKASPAPLTQALLSSAGQQSESFQPQHPYASAVRGAGDSPAQHRLAYSALFPSASKTPTPQQARVHNASATAETRPMPLAARRPLVFSDTPSLETPRSQQVPAGNSPPSSCSILEASGAAAAREGGGSGSQQPPPLEAQPPPSPRGAGADAVHAAGAGAQLFGTLSIQSAPDSSPPASLPSLPVATVAGVGRAPPPQLKREPMLQHKDKDANAPWAAHMPASSVMQGTLSQLSPEAAVQADCGSLSPRSDSTAGAGGGLLPPTRAQSPGAASSSTGHTSHATIPYAPLQPTGAVAAAASVPRAGGCFSYESDSSDASEASRTGQAPLGANDSYIRPVVDAASGKKPPVAAATGGAGGAAAQAALLAALARRRQSPAPAIDIQRSSQHAGRVPIASSSRCEDSAGAADAAVSTTPPTQPSRAAAVKSDGPCTPVQTTLTKAQRELLKLASHNNVGESEPPSTEKRSRARRARRQILTPPPPKQGPQGTPASMSKHSKSAAPPMESLSPGSDDDVLLVNLAHGGRAGTRRLRKRGAAAADSKRERDQQAKQALVDSGICKWRPTSAMKHVAAWWRSEEWVRFAADVARGDVVTGRLGQSLLHHLVNALSDAQEANYKPNATWTALWAWTLSALGVNIDSADTPQDLTIAHLAELLRQQVDGVKWEQVCQLMSAQFGAARVICRQNPFAEWYSGQAVGASVQAENEEELPKIPLRPLGKIMMQQDLGELDAATLSRIQGTLSSKPASGVHSSAAGDRVGASQAVVLDVCDWWASHAPGFASGISSSGPRKRGSSASKQSRSSSRPGGPGAALPQWWCVCNCLILHSISAVALWLDGTGGIVSASSDHWASIGGTRIRVHSWSRMGGKPALPQAVLQAQVQDTLLSQHASAVEAAKHEARHRLLLTVQYEDGDELLQDITQQEVMFCRGGKAIAPTSPAAPPTAGVSATGSPPSRRRNRRKRSRTPSACDTSPTDERPPAATTEALSVPDVAASILGSGSTAAGGDTSATSSGQASAANSLGASPACQLRSALQPVGKSARQGAGAAEELTPRRPHGALPVAQLDFAAMMMAETQSDDGLIESSDQIPTDTLEAGVAQAKTPSPAPSAARSATPVLDLATPRRSALRSSTPGRATSVASGETSPRRVRFQGLSSQSQSERDQSGLAPASPHSGQPQPAAVQAAMCGQAAGKPLGRGVPGGSALASPTARRRSVLMAASAVASAGTPAGGRAAISTASSSTAAPTGVRSSSSRAQAVAAALSGRRRSAKAANGAAAPGTSPALRLVRPQFARSLLEGPPGSTQEEHPLHRKGAKKPSAASKLVLDEVGEHM